MLGELQRAFRSQSADVTCMHDLFAAITRPRFRENCTMQFSRNRLVLPVCTVASLLNHTPPLYVVKKTPCLSVAIIKSIFLAEESI